MTDDPLGLTLEQRQLSDLNEYIDGLRVEFACSLCRTVAGHSKSCPTWLVELRHDWYLQ